VVPILRPDGRVDWRLRRPITGGNLSDGCHRSGLRQDGDAVPEGGSGEARVLTLLPHGRGAQARAWSLLEGGYAEKGSRRARRLGGGVRGLPGLGPLCAFLGVEAPQGEPFPHLNEVEQFPRLMRRAVLSELAPKLSKAAAASATVALGVWVPGRRLLRRA
jgi:hypothetical protein